MGLFSKFFLILILSSVVFGLPTAYFIYYRISSILEKNIIGNQEVFAGVVMTNIEHFLFERQINIQLIAQEEVNGFAGKSADSESQEMQRLSLIAGPWDLLEIVNPDGKVLASNIKTNVNKKISPDSPDAAAFRLALNGEVNTSDIATSTLYYPTIIYAAPVGDDSSPGSKIIAVVIGHLSLPAIGDNIKQINSSRYVRLFSRDGILISSNNPKDADNIYKKQDFSEKISGFLNGPKATDSLVLDGDDSGFSGLVTASRSNGYFSFSNKDMYLVIDSPIEIALMPARQLVLLFVAVIFMGAFFQIVFLLIAIYAMFFSKVKQLVRISKLIAAGDLTRRAAIDSTDELGILSSAFNEMTDKLTDKIEEAHKKSEEIQELNAALDVKIREKTGDLARKISELEKMKSNLTNLLEELGAKEKDIESEKSKYETLLENITDAVVAIDVDSKIIYVNDEAVRIAGVSKERLLGKKYFEMWNIRDYVSGAVLSMTERPMNLALANKSVKIGAKYYFSRGDGKKIPVSLVAVPIISGGKIAGANIIFRDITAEEEIDRAKNDFISIASHQLRTPLSSMKWLIEILSDKKDLSEPEKIKFKSLYASTDRLINLVNDLLSVSRIESGKVLGEIKLCNIADLIKESMADFAGEALKNNKKIILLLPEKIREIYIKPGLFSEAFNNILSNAIIYGQKDSSVTVTIKILDGEYCISVNNTGSVISYGDANKLFTKFFRSQASRLIRPEGSGLGLYIAKSGIEKNGGKIWFDSNEKDGTTFYFTVPIRSSPAGFEIHP